MPLTLHQSDSFLADVESQFRWYLAEAGLEIARRYRLAVQATLAKVLAWPDLGRLRFADDPALKGMRSCPLIKPFGKQLLFYRVVNDWLIAERTMHGARDLPRRLKQPPP
jgi:plasmid stabilization system protein ParE